MDATQRIAFLRWRSDAPSGGNRYDDELTNALRTAGVEVREIDIAGSWPLPAPGDLAWLREVLSPDATPTEHWLVGNIVATAAPEVIRQATDAGHRVTVLMHYFASDDAGLSRAVRERLHHSEGETVAAATHVITTSAWAAQEVARRYHRTDIIVARPGVAPADLASGSCARDGTPMLLWLARVTRNKDPFTFVEALAAVRDLAWHARIVGPDTVDPACTQQLTHRIDELGLAARIAVCGSREGTALDESWNETDLLVHTARAEAYGMVVTEALARGIPSIVPTGTGAVEAQQGAGGAFVPGDAATLATVLRQWLCDPDLRARWRAAARVRRESLPTWEETARTLMAAVER